MPPMVRTLWLRYLYIRGGRSGEHACLDGLSSVLLWVNECISLRGVADRVYQDGQCEACNMYSLLVCCLLLYRLLVYCLLVWWLPVHCLKCVLRIGVLPTGASACKVCRTASQCTAYQRKK